MMLPAIKKMPPAAMLQQPRTVLIQKTPENFLVDKLDLVFVLFETQNPNSLKSIRLKQIIENMVAPRIVI